MVGAWLFEVGGIERMDQDWDAKMMLEKSRIGDVIPVGMGQEDFLGSKLVRLEIVDQNLKAPGSGIDDGCLLRGLAGDNIGVRVEWAAGERLDQHRTGEDLNL